MDKSLKFVQAIRCYPALISCFDKNIPAVKTEIAEVLLKNPSDSDGDGFVYGYKKLSDKNTRNTFWMKLGRTIRSPQQRIAEWNGFEIFSTRSIYNKKLERLVHLFFKYAHQIRKSNDEQHNEIEWFRFTERTNIQSIVSQINELIEDIFVVEEEETEEEIKVPTKITSVSALKYIVTASISKSNKININMCTKQELMSLSGIGTVISDNIIAKRPFKTIDELNNVNRIGPIIYKKISDQVTC
jgi:DNA uptake protein ComE-like DNA-binding protein